ncbi:MAG: hypothetical protein DYG94_00540 [Leptolyngbya sp. PLA3]|nr:MAG: hypothetical protein EDM82_01335 [Cyanobacteria bacterium CYA]MCE7967222.1 hypothetical protein [Leptolyngbya sp. PL-A3]
MNAWRAMLASAAVGGVSGAGLAQDFEMYLVAPEQVFGPAGTAYEVEVWGRFSGASWIDGTSAMAGFGIDIIATGGRDLVSDVSTALVWNPIVLYEHGFPVGPDLVGVRGGQLANLFGFLNPDVDLSNPIHLFTFEVTIADGSGRVEYAPMNPAADGGLSFYPDSTEGASIIAPNDPGTTLALTGARTWINTPGPGVLVSIGLAGAVAVRRDRPATAYTNRAR